MNRTLVRALDASSLRRTNCVRLAYRQWDNYRALWPQLGLGRQRRTFSLLPQSHQEDLQSVPSTKSRYDRLSS